MFHPGETVIHRFIIPFGYAEVKKVIVTYKQNDRIVLVKELPENGSGLPTREQEAATEENNYKATAVFDVELTETESLLFADETKFTIQINVVTMSNVRIASHEIKSENGIQHYRALALADKGV